MALKIKNWSGLNFQAADVFYKELRSDFVDFSLRAYLVFLYKKPEHLKMILQDSEIDFSLERQRYNDPETFLYWKNRLIQRYPDPFGCKSLLESTLQKPLQFSTKSKAIPNRAMNDFLHTQSY